MNFAKCVSYIYLDDHMVSIFKFINIVYNIYLHILNKTYIPNLIMIYDILNVILSSICKYFIKIYSGKLVYGFLVCVYLIAFWIMVIQMLCHELGSVPFHFVDQFKRCWLIRFSLKLILLGAHTSLILGFLPCRDSRYNISNFSPSLVSCYQEISVLNWWISLAKMKLVLLNITLPFFFERQLPIGVHTPIFLVDAAIITDWCGDNCCMVQ